MLVESLDNVLDDYLQDVYWSVYSREMNDAAIAAGLVRQYIEELEEGEGGIMERRDSCLGGLPEVTGTGPE